MPNKIDFALASAPSFRKSFCEILPNSANFTKYCKMPQNTAKLCCIINVSCCFVQGSEKQAFFWQHFQPTPLFQPLALPSQPKGLLDRNGSGAFSQTIPAFLPEFLAQEGQQRAGWISLLPLGLPAKRPSLPGSAARASGTPSCWHGGSDPSCSRMTPSWKSWLASSRLPPLCPGERPAFMFLLRG